MKHFFTFLILLGVFSLRAQVVVNEYSAANWKQFLDNHNDHEDWIELHNMGSSAVDLGGYFLSDNPDRPEKYMIPSGVMIPAGGFRIFWCSRRNAVQNDTVHTSFTLTQTRGDEHIVLSNPDTSLIESILVEITPFHHSVCRATDGEGPWRICSTPTLGSSNAGSQQFLGLTPKPVFSDTAGYKSAPINLTLTCSDPSASIYWTNNGRRPKVGTTYTYLYTEPIYIDSTRVFKAIAISADPMYLQSLDAFNTFFMNGDSFSLMILSVAADSLTNLANGNQNLVPYGTIEYFDTNGNRVSSSTGELNSHGQDSWQNPHRSLDWISRDEMGTTNAIKAKVFGGSDRTSYQRLILRASGDDNYPATTASGNPQSYHANSCHIRDEYSQALAKVGGLEVDVRNVERGVVFLNGRYWGVYGIREKPNDHDYTDFNYGQGKYEIQAIATWGDTYVEYGGPQAKTDWNTLRKFILDNDMSIDANYQLVKDQLNVKSLCDYFICGSSYVASDWINYNTGWWRGLNPDGDHKKWGYYLWDFDATFSYYINYSGVPDTTPYAQPCDLDQISDYVQNDFFNGIQEDTCVQAWWGLNCQTVDGKHDVILKKLTDENPDFRQFFYSRQADLQNTVFSCENMLHVFDSMVAVIQPEMPRQIARWGGSMAQWTQNIARMRNFISVRCGQWSGGMTDCFNLAGPFPLTVIVEPAGTGTVELNTLTINNFPWTGNYYTNMDQTIKATAFSPAVPFTYWETTSGGVIAPNANVNLSKLSISGPDTLIAHFGQPNNSKDLLNKANLSVWPSPASSTLTVSFDVDQNVPATLSIVSTTGARLHTKTYAAQGAGQQKQVIDLSALQLSDGIYFLELGTPQGFTTKRFTVIR